jgi:hypothetical protein
MLNHLELLMQDAQLLGWEATTYAHGVVLTKIEVGKLSRLDSFGVSKARRSAVNAKSGSIRAKQSNLNYQIFKKIIKITLLAILSVKLRPSLQPRVCPVLLMQKLASILIIRSEVKKLTIGLAMYCGNMFALVGGLRIGLF